MLNKARFDGHVHSHYSNIRLIDCINTVENLVDYAYKIGLAGVALTDHESLGGHVQLDKLKKKYAEIDPDFKIAHGNEIYLTETRDSNQKYYHFILIAKDAIGFKMLKELSSNAWSNSYFDRGLERVPTLKSELQDIINKYGKGHLIGSSACLGSELDYCILEMDKAEKIGNEEDKKAYHQQIVNHLLFCKELFGEDFYLEVQPAQSKEQIIVNKRMSAISKAFDIKIVVTTDAHYLRKEDREIHKAYLNSKQGDREVDEFYAAAYLQTTKEVIENLKDTGLDYYELERNTHEVYEKIENFSISNKARVPQVEVKNYPSTFCNQDFKEKYPTLAYLLEQGNKQERYWVNYCLEQLIVLDLYNDEYLARLEEEADIQKVIGDKLETCMFAYPIFLQHYINLFWECGSTVGAGRGSAGAGLNHYLLGITQLDPIKYNLPYYWRYLNKDRVEIGDIDIDLCPSKRELIFEKIREERGQLGCVQVCTYGTETTRSAIATACRGYRSENFPNGIDVDIAQYMTSLVPSERGFLWPVHDLVYGNEEEGRKPVTKFLEEAKKYPGLLEIIENIEGLISHAGIHASGCNFYGEDPFETACFMKARNGAMVTQFSLHDAEYCGDVKFDFLVTEVQDIITQCLLMLQEKGELSQDKTLRELYDEFLHPDKLPIEDDKLWDTLNEGRVLKCFQFNSQVGLDALKKMQPHTPAEMAAVNGIMRLVAVEKGGETPANRYARLKNNLQLWYDEMDRWHLTKEQQQLLEKYYKHNYGTPASQEDLMIILMDKDICGFTLAESNAARKVCSKKQLDKIEELHQKVLNRATDKNLGAYVWETAIRPQLSYSFSQIHGLAYSLIGLQTVYLSAYFDSIYWNTACLRVDSGLEEDSSSNYGKIATAVGNVMSQDINVSLIDINKSQYMFEPDIENGTILYGMKALNGVGGEIIQQIIENRPYKDFNDFLEKVKCTKTVVLALIKSGAFDKFKDREELMREYIGIISEPKKRLTMQNFNGLNERGLVPDELDLQRRTFVFNKALKNVLDKDAGMYIIENNFYDFYEQFFDIDLLEPYNNTLAIPKDIWKKKCYDPMMKPAKDWITKNKEQLLKQLNDCLFQEVWDKYATGNISSWEMEALGFYYHSHELMNIDNLKYGIKEYMFLPENPIVEREFKRNGVVIPLFETCRIAGTVIAKDDIKSLVSILTPMSGVVHVKFNRDYYAKYNRQISEPQPDGTKKVREPGWFKRGTLVVVNGFRRGDTFVAKRYKNTPSHQLYKITNIDEKNITMTNKRWGE